MKPAAVALALLMLAPAPARACASCGCGDPTLTNMGTEKPFAGRLRLGLDVRHRTDRVGESQLNEMSLSEQRADLVVAWAPAAWAFLMLSLPTLQRQVRTVDAALHRTRGLGDVEVKAKAFAWQDRAFAPRHLVAVTVGMKLPTTPLTRASDGSLLPMELQAGTGTWDPIVGVAHAFFAAPFAAYASAFVYLPLGTVEGNRAARSLRATLAGQRTLGEAFALRAGVDARFDTAAREAGGRAPDSGGAIGFATGEVLWSPRTDWVVSASLRVPVLNRLDGRHHEGVIAGAGIVFDL